MAAGARLSWRPRWWFTFDPRWVDWDLLLGDVLRVAPPSLLWAWDAQPV